MGASHINGSRRSATFGTEIVIRNFSKSPLGVSRKPMSRKRHSKMSRRKQVATVVTYAAIIAVVASVVSVGYRSPSEQQNYPLSSITPSASTSANTAQAANDPVSVDQIAATDLAASAAATANLSVANNVSNKSVSLSIKGELAQTSDTVISRQQIAQPTASSQAIVAYKAVEGDSATVIAKKFGISDQTVRWANNMKTDEVKPGTDLSIPSVDGVVYTVKDGDTIEDIASKYGSDIKQIVALNDLETSGVTTNERILLPSGTLPETERPGYEAPGAAAVITQSTSGSSSGVLYGGGEAVGNRYAYGYCTWYAYNRRAELGRPIGSFWGNATTWDAYARGAGFQVDNTPEVGAIIQNSGGWGGYGHVAIVESVNSDGSVTISEMNGPAGWNVVGTRTIPNPSAYNYIH